MQILLVGVRGATRGLPSLTIFPQPFTEPPRQRTRIFEAALKFVPGRFEIGWSFTLEDF